MSGHDSVLMHMVRHVILGAVLPPLVWLIAPLLLPASGRSPRARVVLTPFVRALTHPVTTWLAGTLTVIGWHIPAAFELAQRSGTWHAVQDASFLLTGLLFWWPVVRPWPAAERMSQAMMPLYLFAATLPCDALSAFLVFSDRVAYHRHLLDPARAGMAALADQQVAGAFMWVAITFLYLVPALVMTVHTLSPEHQVA
ncbi:MAG TPA: cytochrome c oxidase assembly protein [Vicinamibacterales bacterium]|nr:cytochrome c oxidase assembly protein [Vicinamibacterales bacterium]